MNQFVFINLIFIWLNYGLLLSRIPCVNLFFLLYHILVIWWAAYWLVLIIFVLYSISSFSEVSCFFSCTCFCNRWFCKWSYSCSGGKLWIISTIWIMVYIIILTWFNLSVLFPHWLTSSFSLSIIIIRHFVIIITLIWWFTRNRIFTLEPSSFW